MVYSLRWSLYVRKKEKKIFCWNYDKDSQSSGKLILANCASYCSIKYSKNASHIQINCNPACKIEVYNFYCVYHTTSIFSFCKIIWINGKVWLHEVLRDLWLYCLPFHKWKRINIRKILCPFAHQIHITGGDFRQIMNVMQQKAVDPTCILSWCVMGLSKQYS